jgi:hypothetical protein
MARESIVWSGRIVGDKQRRYVEMGGDSRHAGANMVTMNQVRAHWKSSGPVRDEVPALAYPLCKQPELRRKQNRPVPPPPQTVRELLNDNLRACPARQDNVRDQDRFRHPLIFLHEFAAHQFGLHMPISLIASLRDFVRQPGTAEVVEPPPIAAGDARDPKPIEHPT